VKGSIDREDQPRLNGSKLICRNEGFLDKLTGVRVRDKIVEEEKDSGCRQLRKREMLG